MRQRERILGIGEDSRLVQAIAERAVPLRSAKDLDPLIKRIHGSKIVMLGEASHGTQEFYEWRRILSRRLIAEHGFRFIAVEGDWPPCFELNRFVRGGGELSAREALRSFHRWPTWMWANTEVERLAEWMQRRNADVGETARAGFYGLDVYSLFESIDAVLKRLEGINPILARRARAHYACFDPFRHDERAYAKSLLDLPEGCQQEVISVLEDLLKSRLARMSHRDEALFDIQQNARVVANAEDYYRTMIQGSEDSWNVRDRHMMETLDLLLDRHDDDAKAIVWAHNTHIGDYRATDMARAGQVNIGGLARQEWGDKRVSLVGFGTYEGEVIASHAWDGPTERMTVPAAPEASYEHAFHEVARSRGMPACVIRLDDVASSGPLGEVRGHRAIGVVYQPHHERFGNYVPTSLSNRYDSFIFVDRTRALEPLAQPFDRSEIPESWPQGQ